MATAPWLLSGTAAQAQDGWPAKPIRFVVTFAAGGSTSVFARLMADPISKRLGQSVWVDNRAGAGGLIGVDNVAKSPPDGYSIVMTAAGPTSIFPAMQGTHMPFDPVKDLTPIVYLSDQPNVLVAHPSVPTATFGEFVAWCKANPGTGYATVGVGTTNHVTGAQLANTLGVDLVHVPYRGAGPAILDLLSGNIKLGILNIVDAMANINAGKFKAVLVTTDKRSALLPAVPTIQEVGGSPNALKSWQGMFGPAGMPPAVVQQLNTAFNEALKTPAVLEWMQANGSIPVGGSSEQFARFVASEQRVWGDLVRKYKITAE
ncbi:tripartite tricarboxylate transporter substrate binding protein [Xylophilus rhododendri]|uniref:Tripartite tricarboxylate transporter substrate binding protein n=1 Tax=Xylophilus rhododendri TaxID=2697032 RepID=A0A857J4B9_9BURK|nr:tripartite tricarboxylate transporter substrate binding protein [Xylophilus rhododendri]QHI98507.1 tripartite tricarboxylate transporter substrate binding protein [Xylophilus rhododendri]